MVAASWTTDLTDIILDPASTTNWTAIGTGSAGLNAETDFYVQGSACLSKNAWTNAVKGFIYVPGGSWTIPTDGVLLCWALYGPATASLDTKTNGGFRVIIGSSASNYDHFYFGGNDTLTFETWIPVGIDPNNATADNTTGTPSGTEAAFGLLANLPTTAGPTKGAPLGMDALRYGRHTLTYLNGTGADPESTFALTEATANSGTNRWGNIEFNKGTYLVQGFHSFGSVSTALEFDDANQQLFIRACDHNLTDDAVSTAYNRFEVINASTIVTWDNISFTALGTRSRGTFVHTSGTWTATNCTFTDVGTITLLAASDFAGSTFRRTDTITAPGSDLVGCSVLESRVAADAGAVVWNVATDPNTNTNGMTFSKGTNAHHAIEFGSSAPLTMTVTDWTTTGFNASDGQNDSTFLFADRGSDVTWTVNVVGGTGNFTFKKARAGDTVNIVIDPVATSLTVTDTSGTAISGARVLLRASAGPLPFEDTVTIVNSGTTATVTHTAHGMASNDYVVIEGASLFANNGVFQITSTGANTYTYTMASSPGSSPTGTILSTFVALQGTTNGSGFITASRTFSASQPISGVVRKATSAPYYKTASVTGTISNTAGFSANVQMISDE